MHLFLITTHALLSIVPDQSSLAEKKICCRFIIYEEIQNGCLPS